MSKFIVSVNLIGMDGKTRCFDIAQDAPDGETAANIVGCKLDEVMPEDCVEVEMWSPYDVHA